MAVCMTSIRIPTERHEPPIVTALINEHAEVMHHAGRTKTHHKQDLIGSEGPISTRHDATKLPRDVGFLARPRGWPVTAQHAQ
jgi:hypothetical protein